MPQIGRYEGSWSSLYEGTGSHSERNRICESAFREWGFEEMIVYSESLQTLSRELNESKHNKDIVRGEGEQLLAVISTSTHFKNYHAAFSLLVRLVERVACLEDGLMRYNFV
jgi:hypothetical protein